MERDYNTSEPIILRRAQDKSRLDRCSHQSIWHINIPTTLPFDRLRATPPFGAARTIPNSPILSTDFTYTGQRKLDDGMGGIMDYKARFYSPYINRFLQPDSIVPDQTNPQSWNRFSYVMNNPVRFTDPSGHACVDGTSYCVDSVTRKKSGSLTSYDDTYAGGGCYPCTKSSDLGLDEDSQDKSCDVIHRANCPTTPELSSEYLVETMLLENPDFDPFVCKYSASIDCIYGGSYSEKIDLSFVGLYNKHGINLDYYAARGLPNPLRIEQVPTELMTMLPRNRSNFGILLFLKQLEA